MGPRHLVVSSRPVYVANIGVPALDRNILTNFQVAQFSAASTASHTTVVSPPTLCFSSSTVIGDHCVSFEESGVDLYEWLSLLRLGSPRIDPNDNIDPYLSRYQAGSKDVNQLKVCRITWHGLIGTDWFRDLARNVLAACPRQSWLSIIATRSRRVETGGNAELTLLRPSGAGDQYVMWQIKSLR